MKKRFLMILLTAAMILVPFAVFAQTVKADDFVQTYPGWNEDRSVYYLAENTPAKGLFKAMMSNNVGALFYADDTGKVVKKSGPITVSGSKTRYLRSKDSEGHWGFTKVPATDSNTYTYFIGSNGQGAIVETSQFYSCSSGKYFVKTNGTVKTDAGFVDYGGKRYFINKGGALRTKTGWINYNGKKYRMSGGVVRTKTGPFQVGNYRYVVKSDTSVCTKVGPVKVNGTYYYVRNTKGVLGKNKAYKLKGKTYHVNKKGIVRVGRHKWKNGKYYYSVKKGYLKTKKAIVTQEGERFLVEKGGLIVVNQKFTFNNREYIAKKNGTIYTGLFKWHGTLYYASDKGVLKRKPGIVQVGQYSYYVQAGGYVVVNQKVWAGGKLYIADNEGHLQKGFFEWKNDDYYGRDDYSVVYSERFTIRGKTYIASSMGYIQKGIFRFGGKYYYSDQEGVLNTKAGIILVKGKYYYNYSGGGLAYKTWVKTGGKYYYAGSVNHGAFYTGTFHYNGVEVHADSTGAVTEEEYNKAITGRTDDSDDLG